MCGIAGIHNLAAGAPPLLSEAAAMIHCLRHRGPDDTGFHADDAIALAHARLSIIDLEGGKQPLHNEDGSIQVVANGEIFNYLELRRELQAAGHRFTTHSDTEVIVHAYEQHGLDFVERLNGQFAIALWDSRARRLLLARDRTGIRPLYYTTVGGRLFFASEIKALFALPMVPRHLEPRALGEIFTFWSVQPPATPFAGVQALPPGHWLAVERGTLRQQRYWDWSFPSQVPENPPTSEAAAAELRELLVDAVRLQLRADVPVGAYLSGGLDSASVVAIIRKHTAAQLRTFSLSFEDEEFDESRYQRLLVQALGTEHTEVPCSRDAIGAAFPSTLWHTEAPILRTAPTPLLLLAAAVREHGFKVVLTGEGADEVCGGYDLFKEAKIRRYWARQPGSARRARLVARLYPYLTHSPAAAGPLAQLFFGRGLAQSDRPTFAHMPRWTTTQRLWQFFAPEVVAGWKDWDPAAALQSSLPPGIEDWVPMGRDQYVEAHTLLSSYLLSSQGDRVAMAHGVETRFPFLDHRLIEYANSLPPHYKIQGLQEKAVLKKAMQGLLPPEILQRPKQPYRAPDSPCFFPRQRPLPYVEELFREARLRESGLFDPKAVRKLFEKCRTGCALGFGDNMAFVGILSTLLVEEMFVRRKALSSLTDSPAAAA